MPKVNVDAIPDPLKELDQWVLWRPGNGKAPLRVDRPSAPASSTKPKTWSSFDAAVAAVVANPELGLGFVFSEADPFFGLDLDGCLNGKGLHPDATAVRQLLGQLKTYSERSPSGHGIHVIGSTTDAAGHGAKIILPDGYEAELYFSGRYFTVTGEHIPGTPRKVLRRTQALNQARSQFFAPDRRNGAAEVAESVSGRDTRDYGGENGRYLAEKGERHGFGVVLARNLRLAGGDTPAIRHALKAAAAAFKPRLIGPDLKDFLRLAPESERWDLAHDNKVAQEAERIKVREEARLVVVRERSGPGFELPEVGRTLADALAEPRPGPKYTIDRLHNAGGNTLLVAKYKSGKTTLAMNLVLSLVDRLPFLGEFDVEPLDGRVAFFNYELTDRMFFDWMEDLGIKHPKQVLEPLNLRGENLRLWDDDVQELVVEWLQKGEAEWWIVDPAARAWRGLVDREGDNVQIDNFTSALDDIKRAAGVRDVLLSTHMGRAKADEDEEHSRGGARMEDWMDHGWYMGRDTARSDAVRWFRADGRDVELDAIDLAYQEGTRRVFASGKTREESREDVQVDRLLNALLLAPDHELTSGDLKTKARLTKDTISAPRDRAVQDGLIEVEEVGTSKLHRLTPKGVEKMKSEVVVVRKEEA